LVTSAWFASFRDVVERGKNSLAHGLPYTATSGETIVGYVF